MEYEKMIDEFNALPLQARKQVFDFIAFLRQRYNQEERGGTPVKPLEDEPFIGVWKVREDMEDSVSWVRKCRVNDWRSPKDR